MKYPTEKFVHELIVSGSILGASVVIAVIAGFVLGRLARRFDKDERALFDDVLRAARLPVVGLIFITGAYSALKQFPSTRTFIASNEKWFVAAATLLVAYAVSQAASIAIRWYIRSFGEPAFAGHASIYRKLTMLIIWTFTGVLILDQLGYKVTTIIAGLGIAGLAVGLALQDSIANLFSGFYLMVDRGVRPGDYIKLDSGDEGFVETVGWRNTKIRVWANNIVLIPNSKLVQSVITNFTLPTPILSVYVRCGVSYDSDLEQVERISLEVAREVIARVPDADLTYEPIVRFKEFGELNVNYTVIMRSTEVGSQYMLHHEFVKALHRRFKEEGIRITLPIHTRSDGSSPFGTNTGKL